MLKNKILGSRLEYNKHNKLNKSINLSLNLTQMEGINLNSNGKKGLEFMENIIQQFGKSIFSYFFKNHVLFSSVTFRRKMYKANRKYPKIKS